MLRGIFFLMALFVSSFAQAEIFVADSQVTQVTVYPGAARVTREAKLQLPAGVHSIVFENMIPVFDDQSLSVTGKGSARVKISGGYVKQEFLKEEADLRVKELKDQIEVLQDELAIEKAREQIIAEQVGFINSLKFYADKQLPLDLATKMPTTLELDQMLKFIGTSRAELDKTLFDIKFKSRNLGRDIQKLNSELALLGNEARQWRRSIIVDVDCETAGALNLAVSYSVSGAFWYGVYDARIALEKGKVDLTSFGVVKQTTGEDWNNVQLSLSTAQPSIGGRMPEIEPWTLYEQPEMYKERAMDKVNRPLLMSAMSAGDQESYDMSAAPAMLEEHSAQLSQAQSQHAGISVTYAIQQPARILANGLEHKFPISSQMLDANFEYSTFPRLSPFAYLGSKVVNAEHVQLLPGFVNLFLNDEYVGKSEIDTIGPGQEFNLYLGVDENVKVNRELLEQKRDETFIGGIQSSSRKTMFKYKLSAENFTARPIVLKLFEATPVSQNDKIKVKIFDVSLPPAVKDWQDHKGVWLWELPLAPKQKQDIYYSLIIEHPREMNVGGL